MMYALSLLVQKRLEDVRAGNRLDDFVGEVAGWEIGIAEFEGVGGWLAEVGLVDGVGGGAGVDTPGADAEGGEGAESTLVGAGDDADFNGGAEEGGGEG